MRRSLQIAVVAMALVSASTLASAQRGGGGGGGRRGGGANTQYPQDMGRTGPPPVPPTVAALVLEHANDLALADSQRVIIESVRRTQDSANKPWMMKLDSLRPTRMPANGPDDLSQEQRDEQKERQAAVEAVMEGMRETNAVSRVKVMETLNETQQKKAAEYENDARKKAEDEGKRRARSQTPQQGRGGGGMGRPPED
jgi:hypothetical protein